MQDALVFRFWKLESFSCFMLEIELVSGTYDIPTSSTSNWMSHESYCDIHIDSQNLIIRVRTDLGVNSLLCV